MPIFTETMKNATSERVVDEAGYDAWLTQQVQEALDDDRPSIAHSEVVAEWAIERAALLKQAEVFGA